MPHRRLLYFFSYSGYLSDKMIIYKVYRLLEPEYISYFLILNNFLDFLYLP